MKADQKAVIRDLAKFLGKDFPDDKVDALDEHLKFDKLKMKKPELSRLKILSDSSFLRKTIEFIT